MKQIQVDIRISAEQYLKNYQAHNAVVVTRCSNGQTVRFPANILQRFVTHSGVSGRFVISFSEAGRFQSIERL
jgi:hypothetical protein